LDDDLIRPDVSIHVLSDLRDPLQTFLRVMVVLNLRALVCELALKCAPYVLREPDGRCARIVLFALTFQFLVLEQLSVGSVRREVLNARGYEHLSSTLLLDQYLCSDA
jgi:hypothetical protein